MTVDPERFIQCGSKDMGMNVSITDRLIRRSVRLVPLLAIAMILLCACSGAETISPELPATRNQDQPIEAASPEGEAGGSEILGEDAILGLWQESAHAATYVLDEAEQNSTCARCHAPANWIPSMDDMPESCMACKFEIDPPPPVIPENEWTHIECKVCHEYKKDELQPEVVWLEIAAIDEYVEVESTTALCEKCHLAVDIPLHSSIVVAGDHAGYSCIDCHDAHSAQSSCGNEGCHPVVMDSSDGITGHDVEHVSVGCAACHDGSGLDVGPEADTGIWVTYIMGSQVALTSHATQREVNCARCHFTENPWGLSDGVLP